MGLALNVMALEKFDQRGHLFPWVPVCLGAGIALYFAQNSEPGVAALWAAAVCGGLLLGLACRLWGPWRAAGIALALLAIGFALAGARSHFVAAPVLDFRYYGAIEGRIVNIDRSASGALRLTLDRVQLERMAPMDTPAQVRVSLHGDQGHAEARPGALVILTGHLGAPGGAVEPGGFDFRRHAWFQQIGAVGYTRTPLLLLAPPGRGQWIFKTRMSVSRAVQDKLPGQAGRFAAAVTAGDRSALTPEMVQDLRDTNLAHLLAISGLHMGLLAGFVFGALRLALVVLPATRHRTDLKAWAAGGALIAAAGYLALSGGNVATQRAFVMAAVALVAVIFDRRALSLRSVALAALIVLVLRPEALLGPGFQMSFSATIALVAAFEGLARLGRGPRWLRPVISVAFASAVAGAATAPIGMAHFNTVASYGLPANLAATPVMGILVMPMAVLAALLAPLGLEGIGLAGMALGLEWILFVADRVAHWPGALRPVPAPGPLVLPVLALGGLMLCLWRGIGRWVGLLPMALSVILWAQAERPMLLVADEGALVGLWTPEGRALSRDRGASFVAQIWLENDGSARDQSGAAALWPGAREGPVVRARFGPWEVVHLQGKRAARGFGPCRAHQIVISSTDEPVIGDCMRLDPHTLRDTGALAISLDGEALQIMTATERGGARLWNTPRRPPRDQ